MSAVLESLPLPEIDPALIDQPGTAVATVAPAVLDLAKVNIHDVVRAQFAALRQNAEAAEKELSTVVLDVSTQAKIDDAISLRYRRTNTPIAEARKLGKGQRSSLSQAGKTSSAEEEEVVGIFTKAGQPLTVQIEAGQKRIDDEKEAKRLAEVARLAALREAITEYLAPGPTQCMADDITAARIGLGIVVYEGLQPLAEWAEVDAFWQSTKAQTLATMRGLQAAAQQREAAAALEAQRLENERIAAEQKAEADRLAVIAADLKRQADELAAQQAAAEARELEAAQARAAAQAAAEAASDAAQHAAGQAVNPGACAEAAPSTLQPVPGGTPATTSEANDDDESDRGCARRLAGEGDDCGPGQPGERDNDGRDDGSAEHGAGLLRALAPRTAHQGDADHAGLTQDTTSGAAPQQASEPVSPEADAAPGGEADHSPDAGEMVGGLELGTDQPTPIADSAAAADIERRVILLLDPEDDDEGGIDANDLHMRSLEFVRGFLTAFAGKHPTQPKESPEWWAKRRAEAEALLPRLIATTGRSN